MTTEPSEEPASSWTAPTLTEPRLIAYDFDFARRYYYVAAYSLPSSTGDERWCGDAGHCAFLGEVQNSRMFVQIFNLGFSEADVDVISLPSWAPHAANDAHLTTVTLSAGGTRRLSAASGSANLFPHGSGLAVISSDRPLRVWGHVETRSSEESEAGPFDPTELVTRDIRDREMSFQEIDCEQTSDAGYLCDLQNEIAFGD